MKIFLKLSSADSEVPTKVSETIKKSEETSLKISDYKEKINLCHENNQEFLASIEPIRNHLGVLVDKVRKLEATKNYLESLQTIKKIRFVEEFFVFNQYDNIYPFILILATICHNAQILNKVFCSFNNYMNCKKCIRMVIEESL